MSYQIQYNDFPTFLRKHPYKVQKISLNAGFTCPNRDGTKGWGGVHIAITRLQPGLLPDGKVDCYPTGGGEMFLCP